MDRARLYALKRKRAQRATFSPRQIPAIAAGYWWDRRAGGYTGLGTAGFSIAEQNGNASFARVQATVGSQPVAGTGYLRYPAGVGKDSTAAAVQVGAATKWSFAHWFRFPNGIPLIANRANTLFSHYAAAGTRRMFLTTLNNAGATLKQIRGIYSTDGSAVFQYFWTPTMDTDWHFGLYLVDGGNADATKRMRYFQGDGTTIAEVTAATAPSGGASLFNGNAVVESAANSALGATTADDLDIGAEYYFPGELTANQMLQVMGYANPKV